MNERRIALSVLGNLREDLTYARLNNGRRVLDVGDLRQYIDELMGRLKTNSCGMDGQYSHDDGYRPIWGKELIDSNMLLSMLLLGNRPWSADA
jgi:hypothetical protein